MRNRKLGIWLSWILCVIILSGCSNASASSVSEERKQTLFVTGMQWNPAQNFNWFSGWPAWPTNSTANPMVYETLFLYNSVTDELMPLLGKSFEWVDDYTLEVVLNEGTAFSDGQVLDTADVFYTMDVANRYYTSWTGYLEGIKEIKVVNPTTIHFIAKEENFSYKTFLEMLSRTPILPEHVWAPFEKENNYEFTKISQYFNENPIGSGAYLVDFHDEGQIRTKRNDNWWGKDIYGLPKPTYITHLIYNSNDAATLDLKNGTLDYSENFISKVWDLADSGVHTYLKKAPYYSEETIPSFYINLHRPGLESVEIRRALAHAFNYPDITDKAMNGYSSVIDPGLMIFDYEKELLDESAFKDLKWSYNPEKANEILDALGAKKAADGIRVLPDGTRLGPWKVECPAGWTEWNATIEIAAQNAKAVGIELVPSFVEWGVYDNNKSTGNFDLVMETPAAYSTPDSAMKRAHGLMSSKSVAPIGEAAYWNYGRYENKRVDELITKIGATKDKDTLKSYYTELNKIFLTDIPAIPMYYRPTYFYTFNDKVWSNFQTAESDSKLPGALFDSAGYFGLFDLK